MEALVLVHPGSLCGSARMHVGRSSADCARDVIFGEVSLHEGPILVIDGFLSDELPAEDEEIIMNALRHNSAAGHVALRVWGCDAGEDPYAGWEPFGGSHLRFDGPAEAAAGCAALLYGKDVKVTGAWADDRLETGCATAALLALRDRLYGDVTFSITALREPEPWPCEECGSEDDVRDFDNNGHWSDVEALCATCRAAAPAPGAS